VSQARNKRGKDALETCDSSNGEGTLKTEILGTPSLGGGKKEKRGNSKGKRGETAPKGTPLGGAGKCPSNDIKISNN